MMMQILLKKLRKTFVQLFVACLLCGMALAANNTDGIQIYHKNLHLNPLHQQTLALDIHRYHHADNFWDTLRQEFALPHYEDNPLIQEQIEWFLNHRDDLIGTLNHASPYLYYILQQLHKRHLPAELVLLPIIESGYNPFAYSSAGAAGIWQIMPSTATGLGVRQDWWFDGRRDVVASTNAALNHLAYLGNFFDGNWLLAIAAYDTGEGNVLSAMKKNIRHGIQTDYWSLPLAQETRAYIPRLLALATIISHPERYPVRFPVVRNAPYLAQIDIGGQIELKHAANLAGLNVKKLLQLNPGYKHAATDPNGPFKIILPIENVAQFTENLSHSPMFHRVNWTQYKAKVGDTFTTIASKFNTTSDSLRQLNPSFDNHTLKPGSHLIIPKFSPVILASKSNESEDDNTTDNDATRIAKSLTSHGLTKPKTDKYTLQPGDTLYMVRTNDNLEKISKRFHVPTNMIASINHINSRKKLESGFQLIIPTHVPTDGKKPILSPGDTIYMVRKGDTLDKIAKNYQISKETLKVANLLKSDHLIEGDRLLIPSVT